MKTKFATGVASLALLIAVTAGASAADTTESDSPSNQTTGYSWVGHSPSNQTNGYSWTG